MTTTGAAKIDPSSTLTNNSDNSTAATAASSSLSCKVILAGTIAKGLLAEVQQGLRTLTNPPHLLGVLANADPAARTYAEWTGKTCEENGFQYTLLEVSKDDAEETLIAANNDTTIDGIIVYYPIFSNRQDQYLQQIVSLSKDVEGLSHRYIFNMYQNIRFLDPATKTQKSILPCTPLAVVKILEYLHIYNTILPYGNRLFGHTICVINRSEVVGRPLAALLANDGAKVYSVDVTGVQQFSRGEGLTNKKHDVLDIEGWKLEDCIGHCDVVISGVPNESFKIPVHLLREGAVCINFASEKNFPPSVKQKASIYVPAIGKMTIMVLLRNLLRMVQNRQYQLQQQGQQEQEHQLLQQQQQLRQQ